MTTPFPLLLLDIGSTDSKWCIASQDGRPGPVSRQPCQPDVPAAQQAAAIAERHPGLPLRVCSSAPGGLRVGLLGLTDRYSLTAGRRAVLAAGGRLSYARLLGMAGSPVPEQPVAVLVLVGGTDRGELRQLSAALAGLRPDDYPHAILVWAGSVAAEPEFALQHRVSNVQDDQLCPTPTGLADLLRRLYADALDRFDGPVLPTSQAVGRATDELATDELATGGQPVLVADLGGSSTDLHYRSSDRTGRQLFPHLGLAGSRPALAARIAEEPLLYELVRAIEPADPRALYQRLRAAEQDALSGAVGALACLFAALGEPADAGRGWLAGTRL
ncbi:MAG TPA: glutamate mutase L, partial [Jatrophihabitans sp.]|nr:glutamate mutase L [Jatrophihabitans sp.]